MFHHIVEFFTKGGIFMIPLGLVSLVSLAFILERGFALRRKRILQNDLIAAIDALPVGGSTALIEQIVASSNTALSRLVYTCLTHLAWPKNENVEAIQTKARVEVIEMERGLVVIEVAVGVSPLLGLLGTVSGLVFIFQGLGGGNISTEGLILARGIAEALNTTVAGLVIAIPCLIAHSYYSKKVEGLTVELETICMDLIAKLYMNEGR